MNADSRRGDGILLTYSTPVNEASGAIVMLHGRGGSAADILSLAQSIFMPGIILRIEIGFVDRDGKISLRSRRVLSLLLSPCHRSAHEVSLVVRTAQNADILNRPFYESKTGLRFESMSSGIHEKQPKSSKYPKMQLHLRSVCGLKESVFSRS